MKYNTGAQAIALKPLHSQKFNDGFRCPCTPIVGSLCLTGGLCQIERIYPYTGYCSGQIEKRVIEIVLILNYIITKHAIQIVVRL